MVVLGGWLGAGKTTLLNRLLRAADAGERIAVLVNDVGEVNLDVDLVASRDGDTVELTNGCVCCTIGDSLSSTLRDLVLGDRPPDRVVVEASGIAEPDRVAAYGDRRRIRPDGIVVAVDATDVVARAADRYAERRRSLTTALAERGVDLPGRTGFNLWMPVEDETNALIALSARGIGAAPGSPFEAGRAHGHHLRLTVSTVDDDVPGGLARLADDLVAAASVPAGRRVAT